MSFSRRWGGREQLARHCPRRFNTTMHTLTRKQINEQPERWQIHYAGVRVGLIQQRSGAPPSSDQWEWHCGFYPGSNTGEQRYGTAATFDEARLRSKRHGETICRNAPKPTSRNGARMRPGTLQNTRIGISAVSERSRRLRHKCGTKEHERDRARHICVGGDGDCLHRDLFYHPIFDGGVKSTTPPCVT